MSFWVSVWSVVVLKIFINNKVVGIWFDVLWLFVKDVVWIEVDFFGSSGVVSCKIGFELFEYWIGWDLVVFDGVLVGYDGVGVGIEEFFIVDFGVGLVGEYVWGVGDESYWIGCEYVEIDLIGLGIIKFLGNWDVGM